MLGEIPDFQQFLDNPELLDRSPFIQAAQFDYGDINGHSLNNLSKAVDNMRKDVGKKYFLPQIRIAFCASLIGGLVLQGTLILDFVVHKCLGRHMIKSLGNFDVWFKVSNVGTLFYGGMIVSRIGMIYFGNKAERESRDSWRAKFRCEIELIKQHHDNVHKLRSFFWGIDSFMKKAKIAPISSSTTKAEMCLRKIQGVQAHFDEQCTQYRNFQKTTEYNKRRVMNLD